MLVDDTTTIINDTCNGQQNKRNDDDAGNFHDDIWIKIKSILVSEKIFLLSQLDHY